MKKIILLATLLSFLSLQPVNTIDTIHAIKENDIQKIREFIEQEETIFTTKQERLKWILLEATNTENCSTEVISELINFGADVNAFDIGEEATEIPLINAILRDNTKVAELLLDNRSDPNLKSGWNYTPLTSAVEKKNIKILNKLLKHSNIDIYLKDLSNCSALEIARYRKNHNAARAIVKHKDFSSNRFIKNINFVDRVGWEGYIAWLQRRVKSKSH